MQSCMENKFARVGDSSGVEYRICNYKIPFINQFNFNDLEAIINSFQVLELPISKNNCQTIEKIIDLKNDKFFIKNFYENLKSNSQNFTTKINNQLVNICFSNKSFKLIEDKIIAYIEKKTERDFNKLIYGKIN